MENSASLSGGVDLPSCLDRVFPGLTLTRLKPGRILLLGTDGIWEACNAQGEMFGKERFQDIVRQNHKAGAAGLLDAVFQAQAAFCGGLKQADDITLVVVKVLP